MAEPTQRRRPSRPRRLNDDTMTTIQRQDDNNYVNADSDGDEAAAHPASAIHKAPSSANHAVGAIPVIVP